MGSFVQRIGRIAIALFLLIFLPFGVTILVPAAEQWWQARQVLDWPTVEGRFIERELEVMHDRESGNTYRVRVRYAYSVSHQEYVSDELAPGYLASDDQAKQQRIYDKLMSGNYVQVRYNPARPAKAVLSGGSNSSILSKLLFGVAWILFSLAFAALIFFMSDSDDERLFDSIQVS
jgi:hypothetical protein